MGGGVHDGIGALPDGIGLCPLARTPARAGNGGTGSPPVRGHRQNFSKALRGRREATGGLPAARRAFVKLARCPRTGGRGTVEPSRRPYRCIVRILRRLSEPPGGRRWPPECGSASLDAMGGGVHDGIGALPDGIGLCPHATVPARAGHGGGTVELARRPCGGIVRILRRLSEPPGGRRWPPEGGPASLEAMGGGVHDGIGLCPLATVPARARNGGTGSPPVRGHRQRCLFRREVPYSVVHLRRFKNHLDSNPRSSFLSIHQLETCH